MIAFLALRAVEVALAGRLHGKPCFYAAGFTVV